MGKTIEVGGVEYSATCISKNPCEVKGGKGWAIAVKVTGEDGQQSVITSRFAGFCAPKYSDDADGRAQAEAESGDVAAKRAEYFAAINDAAIKHALETLGLAKKASKAAAK
jgi:hypothetical protein